MRAAALVVAVLISGCATVTPRLGEHLERTWTHAADPRCQPIAFTRPALGSKWGEFLRVTVTAPFAVKGEARVHVGASPRPLQQYRVDAPSASRHASRQVVELHFDRQRVADASALPAGKPLVVSLSGLDQVPSRDCSAVRYTVEQGSLEPNVDDSAWLAVLASRPQPPAEVELPDAASAHDGPTFAQLDAMAQATDVTQTSVAQTGASFVVRHGHGALGACLISESADDAPAWLGGTGAGYDERPAQVLGPVPAVEGGVVASAQVTVDAQVEVGAGATVETNVSQGATAPAGDANTSTEGASSLEVGGSAAVTFSSSAAVQPGEQHTASAVIGPTLTAAVDTTGSIEVVSTPNSAVTNTESVDQRAGFAVVGVPTTGAQVEGSFGAVGSAQPTTGAQVEGSFGAVGSAQPTMPAPAAPVGATATSSVEVSGSVEAQVVDQPSPANVEVGVSVTAAAESSASEDMTAAVETVSPAPKAHCGSSSAEWQLPTAWTQSATAAAPAQPAPPVFVEGPRTQAAVEVSPEAMAAFFGALFDVGVRAAVPPSAHLARPAHDPAVHEATPVRPAPRR